MLLDGMKQLAKEQYVLVSRHLSILCLEEDIILLLLTIFIDRGILYECWGNIFYSDREKLRGHEVQSFIGART